MRDICLNNIKIKNVYTVDETEIWTPKCNGVLDL